MSGDDLNGGALVGSADSGKGGPSGAATQDGPTDEQPGEVPSEGPEGRTRSNLKVGAAVLGAVAVLAIVGVIIGSSSGSDKPGTGLGAPTGSGKTTRTPGAIDNFGRDSNSSSLGSTDGGAVWSAASGVWGIDHGAAYVAKPNRVKRNVATVDMHSSDGSVQVTLAKVANGVGLVFRYKNLLNYWLVSAVPKFSTWNVQKIVNARLQPAGNVGVAPKRDGTILNVRFVGDTVEVFVNGVRRKVLTDGTLNDATGAGLYAFGKDSGVARWKDFVASATAAPKQVTATTAPASAGPGQP